MRRLLLLGGILSSLLYTLMLVVVAQAAPGYSSMAYTVSELSAIGTPTRALWTTLGAFYTLLVVLFGIGLWKSSAPATTLRRCGGLIVVYGLLGLAWPWAPMHTREVIAAGGGTITDTMHLVLASVSVSVMFAAMAFGAAAIDRAFLIYSVLSGFLLVLFGALTFMDAPGIDAGLPTPWLGLWERINIGVFLLWIAVLSWRMWRADAHDAPPAVRSLQPVADSR